MLDSSSLPERFWAKVSPEPNTGCFLWLACNVRGYGLFKREGRHVSAHRLAYSVLVGPIPAGLTIDHLCNQPSCVNPKHMRPSTMRDNVLRGGNPAALNYRKTHCPAGHEYAGENLIVTSTGFRQCRECGRVRAREYQRRKRGFRT